MKFKPNAVPATIYRLLGLASVVLYVQAAALFLLGVGTAWLVSRDSSRLPSAVVYIIAAGFFAAIGERLRIIRQKMLLTDDAD